MSLTTQLGTAIGGFLRDAARSTTIDSINKQDEAFRLFVTQMNEAQALYDLQTSSDETTYADFDAARATAHTAAINDLTTQVLQTNNALVTAVIESDASLDQILENDRSASAAYWAANELSEGTITEFSASYAAQV